MPFWPISARLSEVKIFAMAEEKEEPRLYSKPVLLPEDVIAPQHQAIHADLELWARWVSEGYTPATCASLEKYYLKGGRDVAPATAPPPANLRLEAIDRTVRLMRMRVPQHAEAIYRYYVEREEPKLICRRLRLHRLDFPRFMGHARSMVSNILRELDAL